jgi:hypothetical protein
MADETPPRPVQPPQPAQVDLERLAEKVYRLMVEEARLSRARRGT